ncbi:prolyl oligopeptidase family serine peptidase [Lysobacter sp. F6437]|uniref:prolyl oligopeptidase family serine peptidase n=1 Tax=Lysobacter sp. F6437 TaxID=3459296 RepID=UPI00403E2644
MPGFTCRTVVAGLLLCLVGCGSEPDAPAEPVPAAPLVSDHIVSQGDCFGSRSYDRWMDRLWENNSVLIYAMLRMRFSERDFERYRRQLDCRYIEYRSDGYVVGAWLVVPRGDPDEGTSAVAGRGFPVILYNRGGNRSYGALRFAHLFTHVFPLAERGYIVAASQYRGATAPQDAGSSPDQFGGDDVRDVTKLLRIVAGLPMADPHNLFMIGQSRGAIMTFRALRESPLPIRAVAIYSGVYDLYDLLEMRPAFDELFEALIPDYRQQRVSELDRRSVTHWPVQLPPSTGVLMFHGDADERAPVGSSRTLAAELDRLGRPHQLVVYPGESHYLDGVRAEVHDQTLRWFERFRHSPPPL